MASRCLARRSLATPSTGLQRDAEAALVPCKFVGCDRASVGLRRGLRSGVLAILASHAVSCIESRCPPMCRVGTATRLPETRSHHNQKFFLRINTRTSTGEFRGPSQARPPLWAARKPRPGHTGQAPVPLQTRPPRSKFAQVESELSCRCGEVYVHESPVSPKTHQQTGQEAIPAVIFRQLILFCG